MRLRVATAVVACAASALAGAPDLREADAPEIRASLARPRSGRPKLVHLWASWCTPCTAEMPRLLAQLRRRTGSVDTVLISLDDATTAAAAAGLLRRSGGVPGESLRARGADAVAVIREFDRAWDGSLPATYVISGEGALLFAQRGITDLQQVASQLDRAGSTGRGTAERSIKP